MVCGLRGVGKTTVMQKAFENEVGVIHVQLDPCSVDRFYSSILEYVNFKHEGIEKASLVKKALEEIKTRGGKKPCFVLEINEKCDAHQMMSVLVEMKHLVEYSHSANVFIVISTSRASLILPVSLTELRVMTVEVDDPPREVIESYCDKRLSDLFPESTKCFREQITTQFIQQLGTRFLDACNMLEWLSLLEEEQLLQKDQAIKDTVDSFVCRTKNDYQKSC